jgi:branched-chain amino acid transport system substrate-binding protein
MDTQRFLINASLLVNDTQRNDLFSWLNDDNAYQIEIIVLEALLEEILSDDQQKLSKIRALLEKQERVDIKDHRGVEGNGIVTSHIDKIRDELGHHKYADHFILLVYVALVEEISFIVTDDPNLILRTKNDNFLEISLLQSNGTKKTYKLKILSLDEFKNFLNPNYNPENQEPKSNPEEPNSAPSLEVLPPENEEDDRKKDLNLNHGNVGNLEPEINSERPNSAPSLEVLPPKNKEDDRKKDFWKILWLIMFVLAALGIIGKVLSLSPVKSQLVVGDDMSRGEEFLSPPNISEKKCKFQRQLDTGIKKATEDFQGENYGKAAQEFEDAIDAAIKTKKNNPKLPIYNDPELQIYKENAKARKNKDFLSIAVVVPIHKQKRDGSIDYTSTYCNRGRPILFGVAMAQGEINKKGLKINNKKYYLEVVIANDRNDKDYKLKEIARKIVQDKSVLGVIGHNSSAATKAALEEYNGNIVVVTSTSTASDLGKEIKGMFYRAVTSNQKLSEQLADYLADKNIKNVAVVYEKGDVFSEDYLKSFKNYSTQKGITINEEIELKQSENRSPTDIIKANIDSGVEAILHFTQTKEAQEFSLKLIKENTKQPKPLLMLGGDSLYECDKLGEDSSGLILSVPWFKGANEASKDFNQKARDWPKIGGGDVNWRTATSYDATIAFAEAFAKYTNDNITRESLGSKMQQVYLFAEETSSGEPLNFDDEDTTPSPKLVKVVQNKNNKACEGYDFEKVDDLSVSNSP